METRANRGPDADKVPPTIQEFHEANAKLPVTPTDFNEMTVHPKELERIRAERAKAELASVATLEALSQDMPAAWENTTLNGSPENAKEID